MFMFNVRMKFLKTYGPFPFAVFAGAFLLFQIQPLIGKYFLPWFGGSPSVWIACLMFFQLLLLGGYAYAHALQKLSQKRQVAVHLSLLLIACAGGLLLYENWGSPILPSLDWRPENEAQPTWHLLRLLFISIGGGYFLLSSSASLLQAWYHRVDPSRSPYLFYIISNTASLLALLTYPIVIEPFLTIKTQALIWSGGFLIYAILCVLSAKRVWSALPAAEEANDSSAKSSPPTWKHYLSWIGLSACGVLLLMAVTKQITQDVPPVPFLWVLPLVLYLLSYIIAFIERLKHWQDVLIVFVGVAGWIAWKLAQQGLEVNVLHQIAGFGIILFACCLFCHNALYRQKPDPQHLTGFYLSISLGGVIGGLFAGIVAQHIFNQYWEYPIALVLTALLAVTAVYANPKSAFFKIRHGLWLGVAFLAFVVSQKDIHEAQNSVYMGRNFFGSIRVDKELNTGIPIYSLMHGKINHGMQIDHPRFKHRPTTYFTKSSGVGTAMLLKQKELKTMNVGVLGLGIGTLTAYGREGDTYRLYEIDPEVIALATSSPWFSYVPDSKAKIVVVEGDGRLSLEREIKEDSHPFDMLILDAFTGDSPPVHILTLEAFNLYLQHLAPDGVIAVNISNRYLDLLPVLDQVHKHFGLQIAYIESQGDKKISANAQWVLLTRDRDFIRNPEIVRKNSFARKRIKTIRPWTDNYSSLLSIIKR